MITYVDSSVLLRFLLNQTRVLTEWKEIESAVTSALTHVECFRVIDRIRLTGTIESGAAAAKKAKATDLLKDFDIADITREVLARASETLPTVVGTLDAIHLITAMMWRETYEPKLVFATHDVMLAKAARAAGFEVIGA